MNYAKKLISELKSGARTIEQLTWEQFQEVVALMVAEKLLNLKENCYTVRENKKGPIDIVVFEHEAGVVSPLQNELRKTNVHYIECKHVNKKLTLEITGKYFCVALHDKPSSLTIVGRCEASKDAVEIGNWLFSTYFGPLAKLELVGIQQLLGKPESQANDESTFPACEPLPPPPPEWIIEFADVYSSVPVCNESSGFAELIVEAGKTYKLTFWLCESLIDRYTAACSLRFFTESGREVILALSTRLRTGGIVSLYATLESDQIGQSCKYLYSPLILVDQSSGLYQATLTNFPKLRVQAPSTTLPDLRTKRSIDESNIIYNNPGRNLIVVSGEAGVGKSFLVKQICASLTKTAQFACHQAVLSDEASIGSFINLLWKVAFPDVPGRLAGSGNSNSHTYEFVIDYLSSIVSAKSIDPQDVRDVIEGRLNNDSSDVLADLLATCLVRQASRTAIVFSNCQRLKGGSLRVFRSFLASLHSLGWGNTKVFIEYRSSKEDLNPAWENTLDWIESQFRQNIHRTHVDHLSKCELESGLKPVLLYGNIRRVVQAIYHKSGGNPLYIEHLIRHLRETNVLIPTTNSFGRECLRVTSISMLERSIVSVPSAIVRLLERRVKHLSRDLFEIDVVSLLGLSAINGELVPKELALLSLGTNSDAYVSALDVLKSENLLFETYDGKVIFAHEMVRESARVMATDHRPFFLVARKAAESVATYDYGSLLFVGRVYAVIGSRSRALDTLNKGLERAVKGNHFLWQHTFALELRTAYAVAHESAMSVRRYHELTDLLGWAEWHSGSCAQAASLYEEGISKLREQKEAGDRNDWEHLRDLPGTYAHKLVGLSLVLLQPSRFVNYATKALSEVSSITKFGQLLNRFVLFGACVGNIKFASDAASLALSLAPTSRDPSVYAVIYTALSVLHSIENPRWSLKYAKKAESEVVDERQRVHNRVLRAVAELRLFPRKHACIHEELEELRSEAKRYEMNNVLPQILNARGSIELLKGSSLRALDTFSEAESLAARNDNTFDQVGVLNNLSIAYSALGESEEALRYKGQVEDILATFFRESANCTVELSSLIEVACATARLLFDDELRNSAPMRCRPPRYGQSIFCPIFANYKQEKLSHIFCRSLPSIELARIKVSGNWYNLATY